MGTSRWLRHEGPPVRQDGRALVCARVAAAPSLCRLRGDPQAKGQDSPRSGHAVDPDLVRGEYDVLSPRTRAAVDLSYTVLTVRGSTYEPPRAASSGPGSGWWSGSARGRAPG